MIREKHTEALWRLHEAAQDAANQPGDRDAWNRTRKAYAEAQQTRAGSEWERIEALRGARAPW